MRKPMLAAQVTGLDHDWSDFAAKGETESGIRCAVPVEIVDDSQSQDDIETLRMIEAALEAVESERPSGPDIETCISPDRRSAFPCAEAHVDE